MEFNEEDGIKLSEAEELIKEINKDTKEFDNWLNKLPKYIESYDNKFEVR